MLVVVGLTLAGLRTEWLSSPWSAAIWPVLGSMFMFRLIVYMYDLKHGQVPATWSQRLSYFFMLPNICFPLFPVVDSRSFVRTHYDSERHEIHQRGVEWMLRGVVQLVLYRIVYEAMVIDPYDVANAADLAHYFLWLFLLYLRVSGQFHVAVGLLHLFGFHLPETHHLYYFSNSFTDFWRRINIYWKDFMMKVFYYPIYFRLRSLGANTALVLSTMFVFGLTWLLHAYQLFWIRGSYVFTWNDVLFWTILCGLVTVNTLWEAKHGRRRTINATTTSWKERSVVVLKTLGTFIVICILWSFWCSESLGFWFSLWPAALVPPTAAQATKFAAIAAAGLLSVALFVIWTRYASDHIYARFSTRAAFVLLQLFVLNLVSISAVYSRLGWAGDLVATARFGDLNRTEMELLERGYYEDLLTVDRFNSELAALYSKRPPDWELSLSEAGLARAAAGLQYELRPNTAAVFKGAPLRTNRWGMHDQEYSQPKPAGCFRIALLGASHAMGTGVRQEETFESLLEHKLNQEGLDQQFSKFEILNFAVYGYSPVEQFQVLKSKALRFDPDAVLYVGHPGDARRVVQFLARAVQTGNDLPAPFLSNVVRRAGVDAGTPPRLAQRRLRPFGEEILSWVYQRITTTCSEEHIRPIFARLPMVPDSAATDNDSRELELAAAAGFIVVDLDNVYEGHNRSALWIAEWDAHPNSLGHQLIANRLFELIRRSREPILSTLKHNSAVDQNAD
jgi:hypothetical protein